MTVCHVKQDDETEIVDLATSLVIAVFLQGSLSSQMATLTRRNKYGRREQH